MRLFRLNARLRSHWAHAGLAQAAIQPPTPQTHPTRTRFVNLSRPPEKQGGAYRRTRSIHDSWHIDARTSDPYRDRVKKCERVRPSLVEVV